MITVSFLPLADQHRSRVLSSEGPVGRRLMASADLSTEEAALVRGWEAGALVLPRGRPMPRSSIASAGMLLVHSGWLSQVCVLADGRRQIAAVHLSGDIPATSARRPLFNFRAVTDVTLTPIAADELARLSHAHPRLAVALHAASAEEASRLGLHIVRLGRMTAYERLAGLLHDFARRLCGRDIPAGTAFDMPLTQTDLADCLGLTPVHINRTLQLLRQNGLIRLERRRAVLLDPEGLRLAAQLS